MAIWPFNRKARQDATLPEEVQEFYESGQKQRTGMAWLLALATLVVTILLAMALFFGGRWIYQQLTDDDQPAEPTTTQQTDSKDQASPDQLQTPVDSNNSDEEQDTSSTNTDQPTTSTPTPAPQSPNTGSTEAIPNTGPGPDGLQ